MWMSRTGGVGWGGVGWSRFSGGSRLGGRAAGLLQSVAEPRSDPVGWGCTVEVTSMFWALPPNPALISLFWLPSTRTLLCLQNVNAWVVITQGPPTS